MEPSLILTSLLRTTLFLTASGLVCWFVLRKTGDRTPRLSRFLWIAVLATGWFWMRPALSIPLPPLADTPAPPVVAINTVEIPTTTFSEDSGDLRPRLFAPRVAEVEPVFAAPAFEWKPLIFKTILAIWLGGMVVSILLSAAGYARFLLLLRKTVPASDDFAGPWRRLLEEHGIDARSVPMFVSDGRNSLGPALVRTVLGYRLVVPKNLWSELSESGRCGILKHEREHFRRRDVWKSFFVRILALPHWFNPVAYLALHRFEEAAELLCDRAAFECRQEDVLEFAETLLLLHENAPTQFVARPSIFGRGLKHRVACLLHEDYDKGVSLMKKIVLITGAVVILAAFLFKVEFVEKTVAQTAKDTKQVVNTDPMAPVPSDPWAGKPKEKNVWTRAKAKPSPEVGKFRVRIDYKLKNIMATALEEFLMEQFKDSTVKTEIGRRDNDKNEEPMDIITVTASLDDHKLIKRMITEIQREVALIQADAADTEPREQIKIFTLKNSLATQIVESIKPFVFEDVKLSVDQRANTVIASGSAGSLAVVEVLLLRFDEKRGPVPMPLPGPTSFGAAPYQQQPITGKTIEGTVNHIKNPDLTYVLVHVSPQDAMHRLRNYCTENDKKGVVIFPGKTWESVLHVNAPTKELVEEMRIFLKAIDIPTRAQ